LKRILNAFILSFALVLFATGCDALQAIAPLPQATSIPTPTAIFSTPTALPTLGNLEPLDAAYCMEPASDSHDPEYNLLRFFASGVVLEATVQGKNDCPETWVYIAPYLLETATDTFNHGEYQFSASQIRFTLAPANSSKVSGTVTGKIEGDMMILQRQGTEMTYIRVYGGK
jgi:hypothetical protein